MSGYSHPTDEERDRIAGLKADGLSLRAIGRALGRAASTIWTPASTWRLLPEYDSLASEEDQGAV
jgi:hypothetical protein